MAHPGSPDPLWPADILRVLDGWPDADALLGPTGGWLVSPDQLAAAAPVPVIPDFDLPYMHPASHSTAVRFAQAVLATAANSRATAPRAPRAPIPRPKSLLGGAA